MSDPLFSSDFLRRLELVSIAAKKAFVGTMKGEKRSTRRGSSVEFADFRSYTPGDDFRRVDWNVYGRLEKLFLKLFMEEEDLDVSLLLDASTSMNYGEPKKFDYARRLAAALGYIALSNLDRVSVTSFSDTLRAQFPSTRGRGYLFRFFEFFEQLETGGATDFTASLRAFAQRAPRAGVAVVISDFLAPGGYETGLKALMARGFEVHIIQLFDRLELRPELVGDLKLVDAETGAAKEVTISDSVLRAYRRNLEGFTAGLRNCCMKYGFAYTMTTTDAPFEELVLKSLRAAGMVK